MAGWSLTRRLGGWFGGDREPDPVSGQAETRPEGHRRGPLLIAVLSVLLAAVLGLCGVGWYWSREPAPIEVTTKTTDQATGVASVQALIDVSSTLLNKPGGYLRNDILPPGVLLDNIPSWEYGVLLQVRAFTHLLRNEISRPQAQSPPDPDLSIAEPRLNVDSRSWIMPRDEGAYGEAIEHLRHYRDRLEGKSQPPAFFQARAKNLTLWLEVVSRRLGGIAERLQLGASDIPVEGSDTPSSSRRSTMSTSWWQTDNVFYQARGSLWALLAISRGLEIDFHDVLVRKSALSTFRNLESELEVSQRPLESPIILSGSGFGLVPSHDLSVAAYVSSVVNIVRTLETLMRKD